MQWSPTSNKNLGVNNANTTCSTNSAAKQEPAKEVHHCCYAEEYPHTTAAATAVKNFDPRGGARPFTKYVWGCFAGGDGEVAFDHSGSAADNSRRG